MTEDLIIAEKELHSRTLKEFTDEQINEIYDPNTGLLKLHAGNWPGLKVSDWKRKPKAGEASLDSAKGPGGELYVRAAKNSHTMNLAISNGGMENLHVFERLSELALAFGKVSELDQLLETRQKLTKTPIG